MTKDQIKTKMQKCAEMAADIASSIHKETLDDEIDLDILIGDIDEAFHLFNRLYDYSEQYENAED